MLWRDSYALQLILQLANSNLLTGAANVIPSELAVVIPQLDAVAAVRLAGGPEGMVGRYGALSVGPQELALDEVVVDADVGAPVAGQLEDARALGDGQRDGQVRPELGTPLLGLEEHQQIVQHMVETVRTQCERKPCEHKTGKLKQAVLFRFTGSWSTLNPIPFPFYHIPFAPGGHPLQRHLAPEYDGAS